MAEQTLSNNRLQLSLAEFKWGMQVFTPKRRKLGPALLAFQDGFLSIESGEFTAVMHATGEWNGRATFSPEALRAIATVPPNNDPLPITYADGHLLIGSITIACQWRLISEPLIHDLNNPTLMDLLALERTMPRSEVKGTPLGRQMTGAAREANRRIQKACAQLAELEITEDEIRELIEARISARLGRERT